MKFKETRIKSDINNSYDIVYDEPNVCPNCGIVMNPNTTVKSCGNDIYIMFYTCSAIDCTKRFFSVYRKISTDESKKIIETEFLYIYPEPMPENFSEVIRNLSPNFIKAYIQAFCCEQHNHIELAMCGYRNALEILIKDYAIKYKKAKAEELTEKTLDKCIKAYLDKVEESISSYIVKQSGNNATHYPPIENDKIDFIFFKECLRYCIGEIDMNVKLYDFVPKLPKGLKGKFQLESDLPRQSVSSPDESGQ